MGATSPTNLALPVVPLFLVAPIHEGIDHLLALRPQVFDAAVDEGVVTATLAFSFEEKSDLCGSSGVSERALQYAFREQYQVTPKQYLIARRLE